MDTEERITILEKENEKNVALINYLQGYIKGIEERVFRLEKKLIIFRKFLRQLYHSIWVFQKFRKEEFYHFIFC